MLINSKYLSSSATLLDRTNWSTTMSAMNLSLTILGAFYFLALVERLTKPEIIGDDGESEGLDQYYEQQYNATRDYYLAADRGYYGDS